MRWGLGLAVLLAAGAARGQTADEVRVGGRTYRGTILEVRPRISVRLRLANGDELTAPWSEVVSIDGTPRETLESGAPPLRTREEIARAAPRNHWYGWQTLIVDGGSVALLFTGVGAAAGIVTFLAGPPIVHVAHGQWGSGAASALLRLTMPFAFAAMGAIGGSYAMGNGFVGLLGGGFAGVAGASAIDAAVLAWEPRASPPGPTDRPRTAPSIALVPLLSTSPETRTPASVGGLVVLGSF
ncbi:MAG TPA: hypothetical protein VF765_18405 [Polyangiaceae bacterium]